MVRACVTPPHPMVSPMIAVVAAVLRKNYATSFQERRTAGPTMQFIECEIIFVKKEEHAACEEAEDSADGQRGALRGSGRRACRRAGARGRPGGARLQPRTRP